MPLVAPLVSIRGLSTAPGVCPLVWASDQPGRGLSMLLELTKRLVKPSAAPRPKSPPAPPYSPPPTPPMVYCPE